MNTLKYLTIVCIVLIQNLGAQNVQVANIIEFNEAIKNAIPGTTIILKNGEWRDVYLNINGLGTEDNPITITAETAGEVVLTGDSYVTISGKFVVVSGLWFKDGNPTSKSIISFRKDTKNAAYNCRLTNCTISNYNPANKSIENHWVDLWGKNNRVDHNNFTGKVNGGTTLVVWLKGNENIENYHQIDHNFFGKRPDLGENGGETIRIGTSENSMKSSKTIVEFNTFKNCDGEIEIISNKSGDNIFRNNLFIESEGTLTLRHGNNALVENNVFIGNNNPKVGGIRIINEGHVIQNNFLINISGSDYRGPIVFMNGVPNSPLNRYNQVKNVLVQNNTLLNCSPIIISAGKDAEKTLDPINSVFANNLISNTNGSQIISDFGSANGITFYGNIVDSEVNINPLQFTKATLDWELLRGLPMPTSINDILKTAKRTERSPDFDITNSKRVEFVAGAFNLGNTIFPAAITSKNGPSWNPIIEEKSQIIVPTTIHVEPGIETIGKALKQVGSKGTLVLSPGVYFVEKPMKINGNITIKGNQEKGEIILKEGVNIEKELSYFLRINEGSRLQLENLTFDGNSKTYVKYALVSPAENINEKYNLFVDNCIFKNFSNTSGGAVFKAYIGTLADTISIKNSQIIDSYRGFNLSSEKDLLGKYNAEVIIFFNTLFKKMEEYAINYTKIDINQNINGGQLVVDHCIFSDVFNTEKGYILKSKGISSVKIKNSVFENSYEIKTPLSLSGTSNTIQNCLIYDSGVLKISDNASSLNILYQNPKWEDHKLFIPGKKSPLLKENNSFDRIGLLRGL